MHTLSYKEILMSATKGPYSHIVLNINFYAHLLYAHRGFHSVSFNSVIKSQTYGLVATMAGLYAQVNMIYIIQIEYEWH